MNWIRGLAAAYFIFTLSAQVFCQAPPTDGPSTVSRETDSTVHFLDPDTVTTPGGSVDLDLSSFMVLLADLVPDTARFTHAGLYHGYETRGDGDSLVVAEKPFLWGCLYRQRDFSYGILQMKLMTGATLPDSGRYGVLIRETGGRP